MFNVDHTVYIDDSSVKPQTSIIFNAQQNTSQDDFYFFLSFFIFRLYYFLLILSFIVVKLFGIEESLNSRHCYNSFFFVFLLTEYRWATIKMIIHSNELHLLNKFYTTTIKTMFFYIFNWISCAIVSSTSFSYHVKWFGTTTTTIEKKGIIPLLLLCQWFWNVSMFTFFL